MRRTFLCFVLLLIVICAVFYKYSSEVSAIASLTTQVAGKKTTKIDVVEKTTHRSSTGVMFESYIGTNRFSGQTQSQAVNGERVLPNETAYKNLDQKLGVTSRQPKTRDEQETCLDLEEEITIVTAFFYLGERFPKGGGSRKSAVYFRWIKVFRQIQNPVVAYFGRKEDVELFEKLRPLSSKLKTKAVLLNTTSLWAFQLQEQLRNVRNSSDKSRNLLREYNCIQHAKYEVLLRTSEENPFCTRFVQWLDIGLFRTLVAQNVTECFRMWLPPDYNQSCVAYTGIRRRSISRDPGDIIVKGGCWLVGATVLANITLMEIWARGYMAYTEMTIQKYKVIVSDQGILYSWMNTNNTVLPVQEYRGGEGGSWFSLGFRCRRAGLTRNLSQQGLH